LKQCLNNAENGEKDRLDKMETEIILSRPACGKTGRLLSMLAEDDGSALLISLESPAESLRARGLKDSVEIYVSESITQGRKCKLTDGVPAEYKRVTKQIIMDLVKKSRPEIVAIDNLEVLPDTVDLAELQEALQQNGVRRLLITSYLNRLNVSGSKSRIDAIECKCTVLNDKASAVV
jgi:hypothetical protein